MTGYQSKKAAAQDKYRAVKTYYEGKPVYVAQPAQEREALKLALEELADRFSEGWHEGIKIDASDIMLLSDAAQALAQPPQHERVLFPTMLRKMWSGFEVQEWLDKNVNKEKNNG
jgi:hypothetical protein